MPMAPRTVCGRAGCVRRRPCPDHPAVPWSRPSSAAPTRTRGLAYRLLRALVLREEPWCYLCGRPSVEVDHKRPLFEGGTDDRDNLGGICVGCHKAKTAAESARARRVFR